jgi:hypothetical protein
MKPGRGPHHYDSRGDALTEREAHEPHVTTEFVADRKRLVSGLPAPGPNDLVVVPGDDRFIYVVHGDNVERRPLDPSPPRCA